MTCLHVKNSPLKTLSGFYLYSYIGCVTIFFQQYPVFIILLRDIASIRVGTLTNLDRRI
jgi:hypothetical protein